MILKQDVTLPEEKPRLVAIGAVLIEVQG